MTKVVNLRQRRKAAARDADRLTGAASAARFGRTKADRDLEAARARKAARDLDAHRLGDEGMGGEGLAVTERDAE